VELSPARQKALFALIVVVLAVLGYFLVVPALHKHSTAAPAPTPSASPSPSAPATTTSAAPVVAQSSGVNIYNWLPFSQQDLADAAAVATQFGVDFNTYTYTENADAYTGKMGSLITADLAATLQNAYSAPGNQSLRTGQKQVSSGTATIDSLRAFGQTSLTFVVILGQRLVSSNVTSTHSVSYAVTLTGSGSNWQVSDIEYASAGNT
jgi:hypothetical protein